MAITDDVDNEERDQLLVNEASLKFYNTYVTFPLFPRGINPCLFATFWYPPQILLDIYELQLAFFKPFFPGKLQEKNIRIDWLP